MGKKYGFGVILHLRPDPSFWYPFVLPVFINTALWLAGTRSVPFIFLPLRPAPLLGGAYKERSKLCPRGANLIPLYPLAFLTGPVKRGPRRPLVFGG